MRTLFFAVALFLVPSTLLGQLTATPPTPGLRGNTLDFVDVTSKRIVQTVVEDLANEKEVEFGDFDNDGDMDVVVANGLSDFVRRRNKLYLNNDGVFEEVSGTAVVSSFTIRDLTRKALARDFDGDGWLDIVLINDSNTSDSDHTFLHNKHPGGVFSHFEEEQQRLNGLVNAAGSAVALDVDGDNDDDVFIAAHPFFSQDLLLLNDGNGTFLNGTPSFFPTESDYGTDAAQADFNGDNRPDLLVTNMLGDNSLIIYNNLNSLGTEEGDYSYPGSEQLLGISSRGEGMEPGDLNQDGRVDIYASNLVGIDGDVLLINQGNDANGKATFAQQAVPGILSGFSSRKATIKDLNKDG